MAESKDKFQNRQKAILDELLMIFCKNDKEFSEIEANTINSSRNGFLRVLAATTLQTVSSYSSIGCGLWAYNGQEMKEQTAVYNRTHFANTWLDGDLCFLQVHITFTVI